MKIIQTLQIGCGVFFISTKMTGDFFLRKEINMQGGR